MNLNFFRIIFKNSLLILLVAFFSLTTNAQVASHNEKCQDPAVLKEMSDRLLVHYYCTTTLNPLRMEKEAGYVDYNGLPKVCNEAVRNLDEGFWMRDYLISEVSDHDAALRRKFDERARNNGISRVVEFLLGQFGWPTSQSARDNMSEKLARKLRNQMLGVEVKTPKLFNQIRKVGGHIDLFLALSSLNSDLTNGCGVPSITNMEIVNGACTKIIAYTPKFVHLLKQSYRNQALEIRSGLNCSTFWSIYEGYLAPANGENARLASQLQESVGGSSRARPAPASTSNDDDDDDGGDDSDD